jgi:AraC-like DNA-binding protein
MPLPNTHFAPQARRLARHARNGGPTLVSVAALAGIPALVRQAFGERVLWHANRAAMLDIERIEDQDCFIPHATMTSFLDEVARRSGERHLGLLLAPHLVLTSYGCWGAYILGAETLGAAIRRAESAMEYHSQGDRTTARTVDGSVQFRYFSAARGREGYAHVALGAVGVMLSLCRAFLPASWRPKLIELDIPRPHDGATFEHAFDCPVLFDAKALAVVLDADGLERPRAPHSKRSLVTLEDVTRARLEPASRSDLLGAAAAQIWAQTLAGQVSIDSTACALDTSVRTLQRELGREGIDFRSMVNAARSRRAVQLLRGTDASVIEISTELGYSSPSHFARAFRRETGLSPQEFRHSRQPLGARSEGAYAPEPARGS